MAKLRKEDDVIVIAGKSKGQRGRILEILPQEQKALVENVNMVKKAVRPNPNTDQEGGIIEQESPIALSNLMLYHPKLKKGARVGYQDVNGKKERTFKDGTKV